MICKACGAEFERLSFTKGRRRWYCYTCRKPRSDIKRPAFWLRVWLRLWGK